MAGLLDNIIGEDEIKDEYGQTQRDRRQPIWAALASGLLQSGGALVAGGQRLMPSERAQYISQASTGLGRSLGGIPKEMRDQRSELAKEALQRKQGTHYDAETAKLRLAADQQKRLQDLVNSPEFKAKFAGMDPRKQAAIEAAYAGGHYSEAVKLISEDERIVPISGVGLYDKKTGMVYDSFSNEWRAPKGGEVPGGPAPPGAPPGAPPAAAPPADAPPAAPPAVTVPATPPPAAVPPPAVPPADVPVVPNASLPPYQNTPSISTAPPPVPPSLRNIGPSPAPSIPQVGALPPVVPSPASPVNPYLQPPGGATFGGAKLGGNTFGGNTYGGATFGASSPTGKMSPMPPALPQVAGGPQMTPMPQQTPLPPFTPVPPINLGPATAAAGGGGPPATIPPAGLPQFAGVPGVGMGVPPPRQAAPPPVMQAAVPPAAPVVTPPPPAVAQAPAAPAAPVITPQAPVVPPQGGGEEALNQIRNVKPDPTVTKAVGNPDTIPKDLPIPFNPNIDKKVLDSVPQQWRSTVLAIVDGRMKLPYGKYRERLMAEVAKVDPTYTENRYTWMNGLAKGENARNLRNINTFVGHGGDYEDVASKLDLDNGFKANLTNPAKILEMRANRDPRIVALDTATKPVLSEFAGIMKSGSQLTDQQIKEYSDRLTGAQTPQERHAVLNEMISLMDKRLNAYSQQHTSLMGFDAKPNQFLWPDAQKQRDRLRGLAAKDEEDIRKAQEQKAQGDSGGRRGTPPPAGPKPGQRVWNQEKGVFE